MVVLRRAEVLDVTSLKTLGVFLGTYIALTLAIASIGAFGSYELALCGGVAASITFVARRRANRAEVS